MHDFDLANTWQFLASPRTLWAVIWIGLALLTLALLVLMRTRWGQARPLSKCVVLSLFAHLLLIGYASMTNLFFEGPPTGSEEWSTRSSSRKAGTQHQRSEPSGRPELAPGFSDWTKGRYSMP